MANVTDEQSPDQPSPSPEGGPGSLTPEAPRPNYVFFAVTAAIVLLADIGSKVWAVIALDPATAHPSTMVVIKNTLNFVLAYNRGGAWGLFHGAADHFRKPFFVIVSLIAIAFIVSLYRKVQGNQWALKWGLPLVLGGALGNLADRVTRVGVVDFIDYRADWVLSMNKIIGKLSTNWSLTDHWPTFNVADIAICIGVGFMALDVLFSKRSGHDSTPKRLASAHADQGPIG